MMVWVLRRFCLFLVLALAAGTASAQNSYGEVLLEFNDAPLGQGDYGALRAAYAASPGYSGRSAMSNLRAGAMLAEQETGVATVITKDDVMKASVADFPLMETHHLAYAWYDASDHSSREAMMTYHGVHWRGLRDVILAGERKVQGMRTFTVLSVAEEYQVLSALNLERKQQALLQIDSVPYDRQDTVEGPILFDISAFFGK